LVDTDTDFKGIVQRLYDMGIHAKSVTMGVSPLFQRKDGMDKLIIHIDLRAEKFVLALGELPSGWAYLWDTKRIIGYSETIPVITWAAVKEYATGIISEFEEFLDSKDAEAVKALLLLTSC
jgi:hypothetical protein